MARKPKPSEPHVHIEPSEDKTRATLTLTSGDENIALEMSLADITSLINALGTIRTGMVVNTPAPSIEGVNVVPVRRTNWALQLDRDTQGSVLAFQHPAYGPVGLVITPADATRLTQGLELHRKLNEHTWNMSGPAN
ncbi:hypothetical protein [Acetobacter oeni]|uniref:Uncharacterized protein n=1 Tax=Acetobacter oeni TaxID=304077 RepID=A0A511XGZ1_9PROT|nr:hypothetical protein [Acetobacter oeni]MBB3882354.1 hypothetical protein [Acetobacter oeni]NHO18542.1 hypothetical protein [Acetobacter oeni]GBR02314.1 hypothetical protein AA21952_0705 [Acetobacter oeni LMG 21952]GEN62216.1 hypothetical protein AOE01nite_04400 [Acetobacter oeni]